MSEFITASEYARRNDVEAPAIRAALKDGRIPYVLSPNQRKLIDWEKHKDSFKNNTNPEKSSNGMGSAANPQAKNIPAFADSRAIREAYNAKIAKLEYEKKLGKFVEVEKVNSINFSLARRVRDAILQLPQMLAPELASMTDSFLIEQKMTDHIHKALEDAIK